MTDVLSHPVRKTDGYRAPDMLYRCGHCPFTTDRVMTGLAHAAVAHGYHRGFGGRVRDLPPLVRGDP